MLFLVPLYTLVVAIIVIVVSLPSALFIVLKYVAFAVRIVSFHWIILQVSTLGRFHKPDDYMMRAFEQELDQQELLRLSVRFRLASVLILGGAVTALTWLIANTPVTYLGMLGFGEEGGLEVVAATFTTGVVAVALLHVVPYIFYVGYLFLNSDE